MNASTTNIKQLLPNFEYELSHYSDKKYGCIFVGSEIVYRIQDLMGFYKTLGYTDELNHKGILPEEFIWSEYRKDDANKSLDCLQAKIITYLCNNSIEFNFKCPISLGNWVGSCASEMINDSKGCELCGKKSTKQSN